MVQAQIDPLGNRTTYQYNACGSRTDLRNPLGFHTSWLYDAANQLIAQQDMTHILTTYAYDGAGRQVFAPRSLPTRPARRSRFSSVIPFRAVRPLYRPLQ